jgi:hypothetical protein
MKTKTETETVYIINLDRRTDRWQQISTEFKKFPWMNPIRYSAQSSPDGKKGWVYLARTIITLIKTAKRDNLSYITVMEDDNAFNSKAKLESVFQWLKNNMLLWDVFNGNPSAIRHRPKQKTKILDNKIVQYQWGKSTNFIIYNQSSYDRIISLEKFYDSVDKYEKGAFDIKFCELGLRHVTMIPYVSYQAPSYSDLEKMFVDHREAFKNNMNDLITLIEGRKIVEEQPEQIVKTTKSVKTIKIIKPEKSTKPEKEKKKVQISSNRIFRVSLGTRRQLPRIF